MWRLIAMLFVVAIIVLKDVVRFFMVRVVMVY